MQKLVFLILLNFLFILSIDLVIRKLEEHEFQFKIGFLQKEIEGREAVDEVGVR